MITKLKSNKILIGVIAIVILLSGIVIVCLTFVGNAPERQLKRELERGDKYLNELDYKRALVSYKLVLEIDPKNLHAYRGGLYAYKGLGDTENMIKFHANALDVIEILTEKELEKAHDIAVDIYLYADIIYPDDYEAAVRILERGYEIYGRDEWIIWTMLKKYGILAAEYVDAGAYEKERGIYINILEKKLDNADALADWEKRIRERFLDYMNGEKQSDNIPNATAGPVMVGGVIPDSTDKFDPKPTKEPFVQKGVVKDSGEYKGLNWLVTDAGELVVTGHMKGEDIYDGDVWLEAPWRQYKNEITVASMSFTGAKNLRYLLGEPYDSCYREAEENKVLSDVYLSGLDTGSVMDMGFMFAGCSRLKSLDLRGLNTGEATDMSHMFYDCNSLADLDLSDFNTGSVADMSNMFGNCTSLGSLDLGSFDTSRVLSMWSMFEGCASLASLDLSSFDTGSVMGMSRMFSGCGRLREILVGEDWKEVDYTFDMFEDCGTREVVRK